MRDQVRAEQLKSRARDRHAGARALLDTIRCDTQRSHAARLLRGLESVETALKAEIEENDWSEDDEAMWLNEVELSLRIAELGLQSLAGRLSQQHFETASRP